MIRQVIQIDEELCNGCGLCVSACHEGAIGLVNGKAHLLRDDYCDGLGDCLPGCPTGAISFIEREAAAYDEEAVLAAKAKKENESSVSNPRVDVDVLKQAASHSELRQWPVQIKLAPINAPYFDGADLLIAADCTAFSYGDFHEKFIKGRICLVGCPKLDAVDYSEKLTAIFTQNNIASIVLARMEVPCCGGLEYACKRAIEASGKEISLQVVTISTNGDIIG